MSASPHADALTVPVGWQSVPDGALAAARSVALRALDAATKASDGIPPAHARVAAYYDPGGNYAGSTFLDLPSNPAAFTVSDLHAVTLLGVELDALSTRRLLGPGEHAKTLTRLLATIPEDADLATAGSEQLAAMGDLHEEMRLTLAPVGRERTSQKWVRAAKLCARKRPRLFPVRDTVVRDLLGLTATGNYEVDYQIFRALIQDEFVCEAIESVRATAGEHNGAQVTDPRLRLLDVALWTYGSWQRRNPAS